MMATGEGTPHEHDQTKPFRKGTRVTYGHVRDAYLDNACQHAFVNGSIERVERFVLACTTGIIGLIVLVIVGFLCMNGRLEYVEGIVMNPEAEETVDDRSKP